jgi:hypothetical protein
MSIARGAAGKTMLDKAIKMAFIADALPSTLQIDPRNSREAVKALVDIHATQSGLKKQGLRQSLLTVVTEHCLVEAEAERAVFKYRDIVGQTLTNIRDDSSAEVVGCYEATMDAMSKADILWVFAPRPPAGGSQEEQDRYSTDIALHASYLGDALRRRGNQHPAVVALVLAKADALFETEQEARAKLTAEFLTRALGKLVNTVRVSQRAVEAAIFPVSAMGFGTAMPREGAGHPATVVGGGEDPFEHGEVEYILKPGEAMRPFNVAPLVVWSLLAALMQHDAEPAGEGESDMVRVCRMLLGDLEALGAWYVPLKGRLAPPR